MSAEQATCIFVCITEERNKISAATEGIVKYSLKLKISHCVIKNKNKVPGPNSQNKCGQELVHVHVRGLGFKFVDFLCKRLDVCHTEIKMR